MMQRKCSAFVLGLIVLGSAGCASQPSRVSPDPAEQPLPLPLETLPQAPNAVGVRIAQLARGQLGAPYRYGGATPEGFDCSGLVRFVYQQAGLAAPRTAAAQQLASRPIPLDTLQPGDLVFYRSGDGPTDHVAIYVGDGMFVHAPRAGRQVEARRLDDAWYAQRFAGAGRFAIEQ